MDNCDVIRDLLPLYVDGVCSASSRALVDEHVKTCPSCAKMLAQLRDTACEDSLRREVRTVMAPRKWRNRIFAMACTLAGFACVPACLAAVLLARTEKGAWEWLYLLAPSLLVMMSTTLLPLRSRHYTGRWTLLGCPSSLLALLLACWVYSGRWAYAAAYAALYAVSAAVLVPWGVKEVPLGGAFAERRGAAVAVWMGWFALLFAAAAGLGAPDHHRLALGLGCGASAAAVAAAEAVLARRLPVNGLIRSGLCVLLAGNALGWLAAAVLRLAGAQSGGAWQTARLALLIAAMAVGGALTAAGLWKAYQSYKERKKSA